MNIGQNEAEIRKERKEKAIANYRGIVALMNGIEDRLLSEEDIPVKDHQALADEYRNLSIRAGNLEYELTEELGVNINNIV